MSELDLMKKFDKYDGEIEEADLTIEELLELSENGKTSFKEKYFEYYDDVKDKSLKKQDW